MMAPVETTPHVTGLRKDSGYTILQNCSQADRDPRVPQIPSPAELCFYSKLVLLWLTASLGQLSLVFCLLACPLIPHMLQSLLTCQALLMLCTPPVASQATKHLFWPQRPPRSSPTHQAYSYHRATVLEHFSSQFSCKSLSGVITHFTNEDESVHSSESTVNMLDKILRFINKNYITGLGRWLHKCEDLSLV